MFYNKFCDIKDPKGGSFKRPQGVPIILTGSVTDMSDFKLSPFRVFTGGFPTTIIPKFLLRKFFCARTHFVGLLTEKNFQE
jgi:hypothetical protein